jgi:putative tryptophan/tyrosine transport system substrate-binding protein
MSIRTSLVALTAVGWLSASGGASHPPPAGEPVLVVTSSGVSAYEEVLVGLRKGVNPATVYVVDLRQEGAPSVLNEALRGNAIRAIVSIGAEAAEATIPRRGSTPWIAAAITPNLLPKDVIGRGRTVSIIPVHVPLPTLLEHVKRVFPKKPRLGMIYNPAIPESTPETLKSAAEAAGFKLRIAECSGPAQLLQIMQSLKDQVDVLLCFPDATLYNSATIKPLVLASLRFRLPLVGFSESFVRAGAALGIYPNFHEIGVQTAELVQKALNGQAASRVEETRKFKMAVNQNITRLLGLSYSQPPDAGEDFLVVR